MELTASSTLPYARLIACSNVAEVVIALGFFTIASGFESFNDSVTSSKGQKLRRFQLAATSLILLLSIIHAGLLAYPTAFASSDTDPVVACALFVILVWVIFLLLLIDRKTDAGYPHYGAWSITLVFESLSALLLLVPARHANSVKFWIDTAVVVTRLIVILVLLAGSSVTKNTFFKRTDDTSEETQPLLDAESADNSKTKTDKKDNEDGEDEDEGDDEDDEEENEWKEDLAILKKRSWSEYVASFGIFYPHLRPRTTIEYFCLVIMLVCTGLTRLLNVLTPLSLGWVINSLDGATSLPWKALSLYFVLYFINSSSGISIVHHLASVRMSMSMRLSLDVFIYNHIMNLDAKFHDSKKTASLGRITDRGDAVVDLFQDFFFDLIPTVVDLFISLAVLQWLFGAYLCFIVAITGVVFAWSNTLLIKHRTSLLRKYINAWSAVYEHMFETQFNWTTVSHFGRIEHEKNNFREKSSSKTNKEMAMTIYTQWTSCTRQLIVTAGFLSACLVAVNQIIRGHRQIGDFVMLITYWSQVMSPVRSIVQRITSVSERLVEAEKLLIVLEKEPKVKDAPDARELDFQGGSVDFEDVTFSYDGERTVSEGITFHANAGQTIALVGETGGGKSTLLKLLFRFYDPTRGRVLVDGQDLQHVKLESFRQLIGIVPQDPAMFNRSIFENVRYPNHEATEEEVIEACKAACLHDKIMTFPKQYKEKVGERGTKLSGGECQRLAIARAILKKPKMLLLDEATSSVDSVTESKIQACLKQLCKGRTTFVIAHRLSTILHADQIMVIKGGKLMEMGPHRKLIKHKGAYRELWDAQLNLQAQDPGDDNDDNDEGEKGDESTKTKKQKKNSLFFNDMGGENIDEAMLLGTDDENQEHDSKADHKLPKHGSATGQSSITEAEVGSEDVTEVESCNGGDGDSDTNNKR